MFHEKDGGVMGALRSVRRTFVAAFFALLLAAAVVVAAGPVAGSVGSKPVRVRAFSAPVHDVAGQLQRIWDARLAGTMMVFGDSITARFNDVSGDDLQGYWSMVADEVGAEPWVKAEGGAGFVNPGLVGCTGHTLGEQLADPQVQAMVRDAGAILVEGGRTDTQTCRKGGGYDPVSTRQLRRSANRFFAQLAALRGADDRCTFVLTPWGPAGLAENRERVTGVVSETAERHGFTYVGTTGLLTEDNTMDDRVHPTVWGNHNLANAVLDAGAARSCF